MCPFPFLLHFPFLQPSCFISWRAADASVHTFFPQSPAVSNTATTRALQLIAQLLGWRRFAAVLAALLLGVAARAVADHLDALSARARRAHRVEGRATHARALVAAHPRKRLGEGVPLAAAAPPHDPTGDCESGRGVRPRSLRFDWLRRTSSSRLLSHP